MVNIRNFSVMIILLILIGGVVIMACEEDKKEVFKQKEESIKWNNKGLEFIISTDKKEYRSSELIYCKYSLKNTLEFPIIINKALRLNSEDAPRGVRELYHHIISPDGKEVPLVVLIKGRTLLNKDDFIILKPNMVYEHIYKEELKRYYHLTQLGKYKITAIYENCNDGSEFGLKAWTGRVKSNTIEIEIIP